MRYEIVKLLGLITAEMGANDGFHRTSKKINFEATRLAFCCAIIVKGC